MQLNNEELNGLFVQSRKKNLIATTKLSKSVL